MKRSEAVILISNLIYEWHEQGRNWKEPISEQILFELEEMGVEPPIYQTGYAEIEGNKVPTFERSWEPEND